MGRTCRSSHVLKYKIIKMDTRPFKIHYFFCGAVIYLKICINYFQVVRALNLIRDSWDAFGTKPESVYIPRGTLQVSILYSDSIFP